MKNEDFKSRKEQGFEELKDLAERYINTYCSPHDMIVIEQGRIRLLEGAFGRPMKILD